MDPRLFELSRMLLSVGFRFSFGARWEASNSSAETTTMLFVFTFLFELERDICDCPMGFAAILELPDFWVGLRLSVNNDAKIYSNRASSRRGKTCFSAKASIRCSSVFF